MASYRMLIMKCLTTDLTLFYPLNSLPSMQGVSGVQVPKPEVHFVGSSLR